MTALIFSKPCAAKNGRLSIGIDFVTSRIGRKPSVGEYLVFGFKDEPPSCTARYRIEFEGPEKFVIVYAPRMYGAAA